MHFVAGLGQNAKSIFSRYFVMPNTELASFAFSAANTVNQYYPPSTPPRIHQLFSLYDVHLR